MKTLIMIVEASQAGNWPLKQLTKMGEPNMSDPLRWSLDLESDWIAVSIADDVREDYEPIDLATLMEKFGSFSLYLLEAHTAVILARYICILPNISGLLIDNDHGWIAPAKEYKEAIMQNADWLYAKNSPLRTPNTTA